MSVHYNEIFTDNRYKDYIQKFWILNNAYNQFHTSFKYALPNGCCTIAFISGNGISLNFGDKSIELPSGIYLVGQITKRVGLSLKPHSKAVMAQVKPWLPLLITDFSMNELVNNVLSLEYININLYQNLLNVNYAGQEIVVAELCQKLEAYLNMDVDCYFVRWVFNKLQGNVFAQKKRLVDLAALSGYSQRRMEQKFKELVGPTPKEIQCILQLRKLIDDLGKFDHRTNLSTLAHHHGYYDHSHFSKSYQRIISEPPSLFNANDYIIPT